MVAAFNENGLIGIDEGKFIHQSYIDHKNTHSVRINHVSSEAYSIF
jgi:hypothetical protein